MHEGVICKGMAVDSDCVNVSDCGADWDTADTADTDGEDFVTLAVRFAVRFADDDDVGADAV